MIFEPQQEEEILSAAIFIAIGFATFENICYLAENGAQNFYFLLLYAGIAAGAMHLCGGIAAGDGIGFVFQRLWLRVIGTIGILGFCIVFHGIYNLLVTAGGTWQRCGYMYLPVICDYVYISSFVQKSLTEKSVSDFLLKNHLSGERFFFFGTFYKYRTTLSAHERVNGRKGNEERHRRRRWIAMLMAVVMLASTMGSTGLAQSLQTESHAAQDHRSTRETVDDSGRDHIA